MSVSVCLIVKNEEKHLERALRSIPSSYEIIVVDTGSTDRTCEIARQYGVKVKSYVWNHDFAEARNYSISFASRDYILILDADEELPPQTKEIIEQFVCEYPTSAGAVIIENITESEINRHRMVRFFSNKKGFTFVGAVHESVWLNGNPAPFESIPLKVTHYGYMKETYDTKRKYELYQNIYKEELQKQPDSGYLWYQFGKLHYSQQVYDKAFEALWKSYQIKDENNLYYPPMLILLGNCLKHMGKAQEAFELLLPYLEVYPNYPDLPFLLGLLSMDTGHMEFIEPCFKLAMDIGETFKYSSTAGVGSFKAAYNLGVYYEVIGKHEQATECYRQSELLGYQPASDRLKIIT